MPVQTCRQQLHACVQDLTVENRITLLAAIYQVDAYEGIPSDDNWIHWWFSQACMWAPDERKKLAGKIVDFMEQLPTISKIRPEMFSDFFTLTAHLKPGILNEQFLRAMIDKSLYFIASSVFEFDEDENNLEAIRLIATNVNNLKKETRTELLFLMKAACHFHFNETIGNALAGMTFMNEECAPPPGTGVRVLETLLNSHPLHDSESEARFEKTCRMLSNSELLELLNDVHRSWFSETNAPWDEFFTFCFTFAEWPSEKQKAVAMGNIGRLMCSENDQSEMMGIFFHDRSDFQYINIPQQIRKFSVDDQIALLHGLVEAFNYVSPQTKYFKELWNFIYTRILFLQSQDSSKTTTQRINKLFQKSVHARSIFSQRINNVDIESAASERTILDGTKNLSDELQKSADAKIEAARQGNPELYANPMREERSRSKLARSAPMTIEHAARKTGKPDRELFLR